MNECIKSVCEKSKRDIEDVYKKIMSADGELGLKKNEFIKAMMTAPEIGDLFSSDPVFCVIPVRDSFGSLAGWCCNFSNGELSVTLKNDKGNVRIFSTIDSAIAFYQKTELTLQARIWWV